MADTITDILKHLTLYFLFLVVIYHGAVVNAKYIYSDIISDIEIIMHCYN